MFALLLLVGFVYAIFTVGLLYAVLGAAAVFIVLVLIAGMAGN